MPSRRSTRLLRETTPLLLGSTGDSTSDDPGCAADAVQIHAPTGAPPVHGSSAPPSKPRKRGWRMKRLILPSSRTLAPARPPACHSPPPHRRPKRDTVRPANPEPLPLPCHHRHHTSPLRLPTPKNDTRKNRAVWAAHSRKVQQTNNQRQRFCLSGNREDHLVETEDASTQPSTIMSDAWPATFGLTTATHKEHVTEDHSSWSSGQPEEEEQAAAATTTNPSRLTSAGMTHWSEADDDDEWNGSSLADHDGGSQAADNASHHAKDQSSDFMTREQKVLALLNRPFGRAFLPVSIARRYVAEVSQAEWDADEHNWKYRVLLQNRKLDGQQLQTPQSLTTAFTWRSLPDFMWLERALQLEFQGGLLLPDLTIALGRPLDAQSEGMPVEADRLKNWLNDILNGIRGQGELVLDHASINIVDSQAMEKFLYHSGGPLEDNEIDDSRDDRSINVAERRSGARLWEQHSFLQSIWKGPFSVMPLELCVGAEPVESVVDYSLATKRQSPLAYAACASQALINAGSYDSIGAADLSTVESGISHTLSDELDTRSACLESFMRIVLCYRARALSTMEKLQMLKGEEEVLAMNWKRFASCLSNLFVYEKDVENTKLCGIRIRSENIPYHRVNKAKVVEDIRLLAKHRSERAVPALEAMNGMLAAFTADLSAAEPAFESYRASKMDTQQWVTDFNQHVESALQAKTKHEVKRNDICSPISSTGGAERLYQEQKNLLEHSLAELCRGMNVRISRMVWKLWTTEAAKCSVIIKAASSLKAKLNVTDSDSVALMIQRHLKEEKEDSITELSIVENIIDLGDKLAKTIEPYKDDSEASILRKRVLDAARQRSGRWDETLAQMVLNVVRAKKLQSHADETTKELQLVRKYATGLREHVNRCVDLLEKISSCFSGESRSSRDKRGSREHMPVRRKRATFISEVATLASGLFLTDTDQAAVTETELIQAGIDTTDHLGWSFFFDNDDGGDTNFSDETPLRIGEIARDMVECRESEVEWLLSSLRDLLIEYGIRADVIEGYFYMECVGVQLEKHFSRLRADALADLEKKADLTAAMSVAMRKGKNDRVRELESKIVRLGPNVSHLMVKDTKDLHLMSKSLKEQLHKLAVRRLSRARESSTERVINVISLWLEEEEGSARTDLKILKEAMDTLMKGMSSMSLDAMVYRVA